MPEVGQPVDIEVWSAFMPAGHGAWLMPVLERIFMCQTAAASGRSRGWRIDDRGCVHGQVQLERW